RVQLIDYAGAAGPLPSPDASSQRFREILIRNETVALSPFVAALYAPTDRFFTQGFVQVEVPLNSSRITFTARQLLGTFPVGSQGQAGGGQVPLFIPPFTVDRDIR